MSKSKREQSMEDMLEIIAEAVKEGREMEFLRNTGGRIAGVAVFEKKKRRAKKP